MRASESGARARAAPLPPARPRRALGPRASGFLELSSGGRRRPVRADPRGDVLDILLRRGRRGHVAPLASLNRRGLARERVFLLLRRRVRASARPRASRAEADRSAGRAVKAEEPASVDMVNREVRVEE